MAFFLDNETVVLIKNAQRILNDENFPFYHTRKISLLDFTGVTDTQYKKLDLYLKSIRQDFTKIMATVSSIDKVYSSYQEGTYEVSYYHSIGTQATIELGCMIEYLFVKYRVLMEYLKIVLEICIKPRMTREEKQTYNDLKTDENKKLDYLIQYVVSNSCSSGSITDTNWFQDLRKKRNGITHKGSTCLVFEDKENLLFKIYDVDSLDKEDGEVEVENIYLNEKGLIYYRLYWGLFISRLIVFFEWTFQYLFHIGHLPENSSALLELSNLKKPGGFVTKSGKKIPDIRTSICNLIINLSEA